MPIAVRDLINPLQRITDNLDRLQNTKRRTTDLIDDVSIGINIEVGRLTKVLFGTDRQISQSLKKMEFKSQQENLKRIRNEVLAQRPQIEADLMRRKPGIAGNSLRIGIDTEINKRILAQERREKKSRPAVVTFQGQRFTIEELDPQRIIEQRKLTPAEEQAVSKIVNNTQRLGSFAAKLVKDTNSEIQLIDQYLRTLVALSARFAVENRKALIDDVVFKPDDIEMKAVLNELLNKVDAIKRTKRQLIALRGKAIKLQMVSKNVSRLADRVTSRADIENFLKTVTGVGALTALALTVASATTVAGWIALPTLVAFGLLRVIKLARAFIGG